MTRKSWEELLDEDPELEESPQHYWDRGSNKVEGSSNLTRAGSRDAHGPAPTDECPDGDPSTPSH